LLVAHFVPGYFAAAASQPYWNPDWSRGRRAALWAAALGSAVFPDVGYVSGMLWRPEIYNWTHSLFVWLGVGACACLLGYTRRWQYGQWLLGLTALGGLSHLILDAIAHGLPLLYPFSSSMVGTPSVCLSGSSNLAYVTAPVFLLEPALLALAAAHWIICMKPAPKAMKSSLLALAGGWAMFSAAFLWSITPDRIFGLVSAVDALWAGPQAQATAALPATSVILADDFEGSSLAAWGKNVESNVRLTPGGGRNRSTGLSVTVSADSAFIYQAGSVRGQEGYLTFWFDPNQVKLPSPCTFAPPANALRIASVASRVDGDWSPVISLYMHNPGERGYKGFLNWGKATTEDPHNSQTDQVGQFDLENGWQKITLGYRIDAWVAVWVNDKLVRHSTEVKNAAPYATAIMLGQTASISDFAPSGTILFDDVTFQVPR
jgi:hypothetical protein